MVLSVDGDDTTLDSTALVGLLNADVYNLGEITVRLETLRDTGREKEIVSEKEKSHTVAAILNAQHSNVLPLTLYETIK